MAFPAKLARWATSGSVLEPSEGKKDLGWVGGGEKPPYRTFNWLLKTIYENILELRNRDEPYATLEAFIAASSPGDVGTIEGVPFDDFFEIIETSTTGLTTPTGIDVDGEYVYITGGITVAERRPRSALSTIDVDYTTNLSGTPTEFVGIASNGTHVAIGYITAGSDVLDVFNATTGALVGTYDCGANVINTVRMFGAYTWIGAGNFVYKILNTSPTTAAQTYDHSAVVTSVHVSRDKVIVVGAGRTTTVGLATIGDDVVGLDVTSSAIWGRSLTNGPNSDNIDAIDGEFVYLFDNAANPSELAVVSLYGDLPPGIDDTYAFSAANLALHAEGAAVDDRWLYLMVDSDLFVYDKRTITLMARPSTGGVAEGVCASDGDRVFVFGESSGSTYFLRSLDIPNAQKRYQRVDLTDSGSPHQVAAIPVNV